MVGRVLWRMACGGIQVTGEEKISGKVVTAPPKMA
jgi:hypothetical protein